MASDNQEKPTTVGSVIGKTIKGAFKGAGLVVLGVVGLAVVSVVTLGSPLLTAGAAIGAGYALFKGVSQMVKENSAPDTTLTASHAKEFENTVRVAQQQAYEAGVNAGQMNVINKLQELQAAAHEQQQGNFADRVKKGGITPEAIIEQRKAAANAAQQIG